MTAADLVGGRTPEELESLLEDAVVLHDGAAVAALVERRGVLVAGPGDPATGRAEVARATPRLWARGYAADPRRVLCGHGLALVVSERSVTVARRGDDGIWRYAFAVFPGPGPGVSSRPAAARP